MELFCIYTTIISFTYSAMWSDGALKLDYLGSRRLQYRELCSKIVNPLFVLCELVTPSIRPTSMDKKS
jgi:hypothetical protein